MNEPVRVRCFSWLDLGLVVVALALAVPLLAELVRKVIEALS